MVRSARNSTPSLRPWSRWRLWSLESNIIAPKVMGHSVQLPPIVVLISITAAYQVAGILGAIVAVPVMANAKISLCYVWAKIQSRDPFPSPRLSPAQEGTALE
ncbi:MAG TPA: AI-2E family transporter [Acidimicrobiia bacterium]